MNAFLDPDYARPQFVFANIIRSLGQPLFLIPLLSMATSDIPRSEAGSASALFNMTRNLGGSVGIALLSTLITNREHLHSVRLGSLVTPDSPYVQQRLDYATSLFLAKGLDPVAASESALKLLGSAVQKQAYLMAFSDAFYVIGAILGGCLVLLVFIPKPKQLKPAEAG
jgi:DHA2 family multidrug resistance protein